MLSKLSHRESGIVLLAALMVVMILFATTTVVLNFSMSESEVLELRLDELEAFYLAEGGIESAKFEIVDGVDTDEDGLGTLVGSNTKGSYSVTAIETAGVYDLTATGTASGGSVVTLETTVEFTFDTVFPGAAMSFVGNMTDNEMKIKLKLDGSIILHGGSGPALSFSDQGMYDSIGQEFAEAIHHGDMPATNLTGGVTNTFTHGGTDSTPTGFFFFDYSHFCRHGRDYRTTGVEC